MSDDYDDAARLIYRYGDQKKVHRQSGRKVKGVVDTESMHESNILVAAHVDPRVKRVVPQPVTFDLNTGRQYQSKKTLTELFKGTGYEPWIFTPDFRLVLKGGREVFVEGKHERWLRKNPDFEQVISAMMSLGHQILVVTDTVFTRDLIRNLRTLKVLKRELVDSSKAAEIKAKLDGPITAKELGDQFGLTNRQIKTSILDGLLETDLSAGVFCPSSTYRLANGSRCHLEVLDL